MKGGLCDAVAAERSAACKEGLPGEVITDEAPVFVLDTQH